LIRAWFRRRTLERSFAVSTGALVVVLTLATLVLVHSRVAGMLREGLENRGQSMAASIAAVATPSLLAYNYPALQMAAEAAARDEGVAYIVLHDKEGNRAGIAGRVDLELVDGAIDPATRAEAWSDDLEVRAESGALEPVLEVSVPVRVDGVEQAWGTVRIGLLHEPVLAKLRELDLWLTVFGLLLAGAAVGAGRWSARRITAPLRRLAEATEAVAEGRGSHRVEVRGARELAEVARAFNDMADRVEDKARESRRFQEALEALNATLEEQVHERTLALEESEAQYKGLVEHSPDSILIVQGGRIRFMNRAFVDTFGIDDDAVRRRDFDLSRIFDPSSAALASGRIAAWEAGESSAPVEVIGKDAAGNLRHLELRGSGIEYRGARAAECLLIDTTEARRLRERLVDTERLRALGELSSGVAHDFNNLLGAILGRVQLLKRRPFDRSTSHDLGVIERAALDGRETVRRIMEFTRTRQASSPRPVRLDAVIADAVEITRTKWKTDAERRNVDVSLVLRTEEVPPVLGKDAEFREVFTNLILNAVDAMPQGGQLRLSCRREGGHVVAEVGDSGVGMTDEIRRHLFDPFFTTKGLAGTGLGLSVVYGIVSRYDGTVDVETALGRGTTFRLTFPVAEILLDAADVAPGRRALEVPPSRVLVIDDEPDIADILRDTLVSEGHEVEVALSGEEGLKKLALDGYDVVFSDLGMPDMSGWEVAERVRGMRPGLPVVLVTGWGASLDEDEIRRHDIAAVVHKPFEIEHLLSVAGDVLVRAARTAPPDTGAAGADPARPSA